MLKAFRRFFLHIFDILLLFIMSLKCTFASYKQKGFTFVCFSSSKRILILIFHVLISIFIIFISTSF
jgi:hypothetical protein